MDEYTCQFRELQDISELEEDEIYDFVGYFNGLQPDILEYMNQYHTSQEAYLESRMTLAVAAGVAARR